MIKTLVYAITYNNAAEAKAWLNQYKDADLFLIIDLGSTDNTIEILSEDLRVFSYATGLLSAEYTDILKYADSQAKKLVSAYQKDNETWVLLNFELNESFKENIIQETKENYSGIDTFQITVKNKYNNSIIRGYTSDIENIQWVYEKDDYSLQEVCSVIPLESSLEQRDLSLDREIEKKIKDFYSKKTFSIEDLTFIQKLLFFCKTTQNTSVFDPAYYIIRSCYSFLKEKFFRVDYLLRLWVLLMSLLYIGIDFYPEYKFVDFNFLYSEMNDFFRKFKNSEFLFKRIPYDLAVLLISDKAPAEKCISLLDEALNISSNSYTLDLFSDLSDAQNSEIQKLKETLSPENL